MAESGPFDPPRPRIAIAAGSDQARRYGAIALRSLAALGVESFVGFGLGFAPGWANGWMDGRIAIHEVWSTGMATVAFAMLVTATIGLGASLGLLLSRPATTRRHARIVFGTWIVAGTILALASSLSLYRSIHASAMEMWPNGYP